jgi:hypothetical protein
LADMPSLVDGIETKLEKVSTSATKLEHGVKECVQMWSLAGEIQQLTSENLLTGGFSSILENVTR